MAASAAGVPGGHAPSLDVVRAAHARLLKNHDLQFDFKGKPVPPKLDEPEWLKAIGRFIVATFNALYPILVVLFWIGVAVAVAALLYLIGRELMGVRFARRRRAAAARATPVDWRPEAWKARALLEDADRLAEQGAFDEAVHLILFRSIDDIEGRRPRTVRPALTSRDIAALEAVPGVARDAFAKIAHVVEASFFGGRSVDRDAFAACRKAYEDFAFPEVWV